MSRFQNRQEESGFFTIWMLGLVMIIFAFGGLSLDLWKGFTERRELAAIADSAAIAGSSWIDLDAFKNDGGYADGASPPLDQSAAVEHANEYIDDAIAASGITLSDRQAQVVNNQVQVQLSEKVSMTLTLLFTPGHGPYTATVTSNAEPRVAQ